MKNLSLPPAQEAIYSQLFTDNPIRKIQFDQAYAIVQQSQLVNMSGGLEHEDILEALRQVENLLKEREEVKKVRKRTFMVACELMLSREMGLFDPVAFALAEDEGHFYIFTQVPTDTGDKQYEWLSNLASLDDLLGSLNSMSTKELKQLRLRMLKNPYDFEANTQKTFNWLDVARKCDRPLLYDFQMESPSACYVCIIAKVPKQ